MELQLENLRFGTELLKRGFAKMQKGGVIMDVTTPEQAIIAEEAGAVAVMALHAVPADIRKMGGVARMADPAVIESIIESVTIPVMAKARIGHFVEAQILEAIGVDMADESEVLTPADEFHIDKTKFTIPFVCGARNLGEALRRIAEGAAMIRTKGEAGTGDVSQAVKHMKLIIGQIRSLKGLNEQELMHVAREIEANYDLVSECARLQRLPVVNFAAGGIATPADAALMMQLGADGVFVGSGIFKSENPSAMASAIVQAVHNYENPLLLAQVSKGLGAAMKGLEARTIPEAEALQIRGW
ncbi:MAG: pyridoxal 5'-phosphate synthase lyase subunit PdxS [Methanotrichaceae archaeon]|nr:pyridoxal 5'-phosphate synthase lyase subunit PdxS [Methanotrichaceae archaeon]